MNGRITVALNSRDFVSKEISLNIFFSDEAHAHSPTSKLVSGFRNILKSVELSVSLD